MPAKLSIKPGDRYGKLTVVSEGKPDICGKYKKRRVICVCECGKRITVRLENIRSGHTSSCGCNRFTISSKSRLVHGMARTRLYRIWNGMKQRVSNPNVKSYQHYGEQGVFVCPEWDRFEPFCEWAVTNGYRDDLTIERTNPFGNYEPSNCTWIPKSEQSKNRRRSAREKHDRICSDRLIQ